MGKSWGDCGHKTEGRKRYFPIYYFRRAAAEKNRQKRDASRAFGELLLSYSARGLPKWSKVPIGMKEEEEVNIPTVAIVGKSHIWSGNSGQSAPIKLFMVIILYASLCVCVWGDVWAEERKQLKWCCWGAAAQMMTKRDDNQGCCLALDLPCSTTIPLPTMVSARKWRCSGGSLWPQTDAKWTEEAIKPENIPKPISVRRCWQMD